ncbi:MULTISPECIES: ESPR-type extended signal peptide-containing protein [unclassified Snodgrassella]|uniref:ESPR-type extended signal peptide-containing protein n=1 Tax=unclassified Snodgrassella TaxID=2625236 RepID=UPI0018DDF667|nr:MULTISPECIES: ESPR-type extended signal peptide-containing protein [unclassified Snodgrassella]MBI0068128.1 YadA-like family protein [Snodgrassella sp. M0110]MBI0077231.1 YadA-like family protein [Snodgrassella sp. M0118]MBI0079428.1 YadA-like family protein [Snodgrassella sp. M0112]
MNKVYRNVWNENTQTWVAASELANSKTKSNTVCEQSIVKKIINKLGLKKIVSVTITALILEWQAIAPVYAANAAIVGGNNSGTVWPGGGYQYGGHGSMVFSGDDDHCGADRVNGRRTVSDGITAKDEYLRFIRNTAFTNGRPYGSVTSNKAEAWSDEGKTDSGTGYQAAPTGGDNNAMPVAYGIYSFAYGCGSYATGNYSTAFGANATATAGGAMAFGVASLASGAASIAFGISSQATGISSVALGSMASSNGTGSVAVGLSSAANKDAAVALGAGATASGNSSVAVGNAAQAVGDQSISIGAGNQVSGRKSGAIGGVQSNAIFKDGEIIAAQSNPTNITGNNTYSLGNENGTIAVDDSGVFGNKNTISGTTEGVNNIRIVGNNNTVSSAKDLVFGNDNTVSSAKDLVFGNDNTVTATRGLILGNDNTVNADRGLIIGNNTSTGANATDAIAIGNSVSVSNASGIAIGTNATTIVDTGVALGSGSVADIEKGKTGFDPTGTNSAANNPTWTSTAGAVAIGNAGSGITRQLTGLAAGTNDTDAVNVAQMKNLASVTTTGLSSLSTAVSKVGDMSNVNSNISTLNSNVSALQSDALQWKNNADGSGAYDASHGTNQAQKITNVAAGLVEDGSTDAVNASQLYQVSTSSASGITSLSTAALSTTGKLNTVSNNVSALQSDALQWKNNVNGIGGFYDASHGTNQAQKITNVAAGLVEDGSTDAVNASQLYQVSTSSASGITSLSTAVSRVSDMANVNGNISTLSSSVADLKSDALQWKKNTDGSGAYDASHGTNQAQKITNVADGQLINGSTDAVNAGQLYQVSTSSASGITSLSTAALSTTGKLNTVSSNVSALQSDALQWKNNADGSGAYDASHGTNQAQKITNVAAGQLADDSTDAVNASQLYQVSTSSASGITSLSTAALNTTGKLNTVSSNVSALQSDALQWKKNTDGSGAYDASHGTNQAQKITNVAAGQLADDSTDAVNASQLYQVSTSSASGITSLSTAALSTTGKLNTVSNNVSALQSDALQWKNNVNGIGGFYDASHGTNQAQKITNVAAGQLADNSTDAVNAGQLYQVSTSSASGITSLSTAVSRVSDMANVNGNISTLSSSVADLKSDALQWKKNTDGSGAYDASHGTNQAQKITNVADGQLINGSTDAVNAGQLYQVSTSSASGITSLSTAALSTTGKLNTVSSNVSALQSDALQWKNNADGSGAYDASHGTNLAQKITNVAAGQLADNSTDAVNASQLYQVSTSSASGITSLSTAALSTTGKLNTVSNNVSALQSDALQWKNNVNGIGGFYDASHGTNQAQKITNVAAGQLADNSTDAVNASQLYHLSTSSSTSFNSLSTAVSRVSDIANVNGNISTLSSSVADLQSDALQWKKNTNGSGAYDASHGTNQAQKITNVAAGLINENSTDAINAGQLYQVSTSSASGITSLSTVALSTTGKLNTVSNDVSALKSDALQWKSNVDGSGAYDASHGTNRAQKITNIAAGHIDEYSTEAVNAAQFYQLSTSSSTGLSTLSSTLNRAGDLTNVNSNISTLTTKVNDLVIDALQWHGNADGSGFYDASHGTNRAQRITNIAAGQVNEHSTDAVNAAQLYSLSTTTSTSLSNLNEAVATTGNIANISHNVNVLNDQVSTLLGGALQWKSNADGSGFYDASHATSSPQKISNVAAGVLDEHSTDAVNAAQLYSLSTITSTSLSNLNEAVATTGNISTVASNVYVLNTQVSSLLSNALQWHGNADGSGFYDASHGTSSPQKISNLAAGVLDEHSTDAVNAAQLYSLSTTTSTSLSNLNAAVANTGNVTNITNNVTQLMADALQWKKNTDGSGVYDASHGTTQAQKITNVAAGQLEDGSTDAVNASQLYQLSTSSATNFSSLSTVVSRAGDLTNINGSISTANSNIAALQSDALQWKKNTDGTGAYDASHGTTQAQKITNVAAGLVEDGSTDAVNASQLYQVSTSSASGIISLSTAALNTTGKLNTVSSNVSDLQSDALQWKNNTNGSGAYDASHGTNQAQKITNVAAGQLEDGSTDAVNAGQLYQLSTSSATSFSSLSTVVSRAGDLTNINGNISTANSNIAALQSDALQWKKNTDGSGAYDASHGTNLAQKITNVANGDLTYNSTDAVNGSQLSTTNSNLSIVSSSVHKVNDTVNKLEKDSLQWVEEENGNSYYDASHGVTNARYRITNVANGSLAPDSSDVVNGSQLYTTNSSINAVSTSVNSVTAAVTRLQDNTLQWNGSAYDAGHGSTMAQKITRVAEADLAPDSTDAVNGSQLNQTNSRVGSLSSTVANLNDSLNKTNTRINSIAESTSRISDNLSSATDRINTLDQNALQINGENYDANYKKITNITGGKIERGSNEAVTGGQLFTTNDKLNTVSSSVGNLTGRLNGAIDRLDTVSGATATLSTSLAEVNTSISDLRRDALGWNGNAYDASHSSGTAQKITNVANGTVSNSSTDAVNGSQLYNLSTSLSSSLSTVTAGNNTGISTTNSNVSTLSSSLSSAVNNISNLQRDALQWNGNAYDASHGSGAAQKITNVANGTLSSGSTDAVNGDQLYNLSTSLINSLSTVTAGNNTSLSTTNSNISTLSSSLSSAVNNISNLQRDALQWNGNAYDASHGSGAAQKITNVANGTLSSGSTDAVNGDQLYNLSTSLINSLSTVTAGNNTSLSTTNSNISTLSSSLSSAVNNISNLQRDALQWNGNAYDASHGSGAAQKITNVANGTLSSGSTDAVNGDQLYNLSTSLSSSLSTVTAGNNTGLSTTNSNVSTLSSSLSSAVNNISNLQRDALQWNGNAYDASHGSGAAQKITNVANGTLSSGSTDAVNGDQLYNLSTSLSSSLSTATAGNNTGLSTTNSNISTLSSSLSSAVNNISNLQRDALQWNGNAYDASHGSGAAQKITNVAAGQLADGSTDAVNAGQLYSISSSIISSVSSSVDQVVTESRTTIETMNKDIKAAQDDIKTAQDDIKTSKRLIDELQKNSVHFDDGTTAFSNQLTREASNERTISGVADGRVDATSNQAVNGRQLYSLSTSTSTSLSSLQDQLHLASGTIPAGISTTLSSLQLNALQWNGSAYDASHGSGTAQKITNVASGDTGQNSTEAVNGSQLWQMKNEWKQDLQSLSSSVDTKLAQNSGGGNASAINEATEKANQAISDTQKLSASTADALSAVAASLGGNASYNPLTRAGTGGFTAPSYTTSNADGTAVTANNVGDAINNLYNGGSKYAKVNSTQAVASASGSDAIAVGGAAAASGKAAVAIGSQAAASAENGVAIGNHASVTQNGGIALGANSVANTAAGINGYIPVSATAQQARAIQATTSTQAAVSVGDAANGVYRQITGVAAGTADTDAVNVAQLKGVNARMENINRYVNDVNDRVHRVERRAYSGTALAMALSGAYLPQLNAGEQTVGVGMGSYHGYAAVGINYKATNNTGKFSWGAGVSTTGRETGFNAGIGYKW